jgi:hypothetical protein
VSRARAATLAALSTALVAIPATAWLVSSPGERGASQLPFANEGTGLAATDVQAALAELSGRVKVVESGQAALQGSAATQDSRLTTVQGSAQAQESRIETNEVRVASLESKVAESTPHHRRLGYSDSATASNVTPTYASLRTVGTFAKSSATTSVLLVWSTHLDVAGDPGSFCDFQLRVDGKPDVEDEGGGGGRAVVYVPAGAAGGSGTASVAAWFSRVGAGSHTVSVWVRGSARECSENYGNFPRSVLVEEGPRG